MYEPTLPALAIVRSRISSESWSARVDKARERAKVLDSVAHEVDEGSSLDGAIRAVVPSSRRSWVIHHWPSFRKVGWEALIDQRVPREPKLAKACGPLIEAARAANRRLSPEEALQLLRDQHVAVLPSFSTIKTYFARSDDRARYQLRKKRAAMEVVELPLAGAELLAVAELESGGIGALTDQLLVLQKEAIAASKGREPVPDRAGRDEQGHFTSGHNRGQRRKRGEAIASYLRTAAEKAKGKVPSWPRFVHEGRGALDSKLRMLTFGWTISETQGWDALRAPQVAGLASVCGFAYLPSTLAKFTSALAQSDAGPRLLQTVGVHWHQVAEERWEERGAMAAIYVDNHAKEVWTSLFTQSGKVSRLNRVMPCITTTYIHTGAGTPLVASVQSGAAPLAPRLVELVTHAERVLGGDVERAVVVDSEGSTFDILTAFTDAKRVIVTPLKPSRVSDLEFRYTRGSYFRPYRAHDELRVGRVVLTQKSTGRSLTLGALRVRRAHRANDTVLLTNGLDLEMEGPDLADLYFARWPLQENAFKDGGAVHLAQHRGNCRQVVSNIAVVTELDKLEKRTAADQKRLSELSIESVKLEEANQVAQREAARTQARLAVRRQRIETLIKTGRVQGKQLGRAAIEQQEALHQAEAAERARQRAETHQRQAEGQRVRLQLRVDEAHLRQAHLQPQRHIRQVDVALDSVLTAAKLTAAMLISFVLREYLAIRPMSPQTFLSRILTVPGRKELRPAEERVVFYENPRDPEINAALASACGELNRRTLRRGGRNLHFEILPRPQSSAPIPFG